MPKSRFEMAVSKDCRASKRGSKGVVPDQRFFALEAALTGKGPHLFFRKKLSEKSLLYCSCVTAGVMLVDEHLADQVWELWHTGWGIATDRGEKTGV